MPDWRKFVRARLMGSRLSPTTEMDVTEELAQHIEDRYRELCAAGRPEDEAAEMSLRELDGEELLSELDDALPRDREG